MYKIEYTREFQKDYMKLKQYPSMVRKLEKLIKGLYENPFYHAEKLEPKWKNRYSLRMLRQSVFSQQKMRISVPFSECDKGTGR